MSLSIRLFRLLLLMISFYGYIQYVQKRININLAIGFVFSSVGSLMFFAGLLNILPETALVIFVGGLLLAVMSMRHKESIRNVLSGGTLFFFAVGAFCLYILYGSKFLHFDNFSHWAKVCQILIQSDRFPNFSDSNFYYPSYPPGSAAFIYYMSHISGISSEWFQMFAQAILMVGLLSGLFSFSNRIIFSCITGFCGIVLLCGDRALVDLLVDTLLPIVGLSGMCVCLYYRNNLDDKVAYLIPYTVFLVAIKNSGALFASVIICYSLYKRNDKKKYKSLLLLILPPIICMLLWNKHIDYGFLADKAGKHAMTLANYSAVFKEKQVQDIIEIGNNIVRKTLSFQNKGLGLLGVAVALWLVCCVVRKQKVAIARELTALAVLSYFVYQIGLLGMYIFSMPLNEADDLAGYDRYHRTILIFTAALVLVEALLCFASQEEKPTKDLHGICCLVGTLISLVLFVSPDFSYLQKQDLSGSAREYFDSLIQEYDLPPNKSYVILMGEGSGDTGYLRYMTGYLLNPKSYALVNDSGIEKVPWEKYDYVIIFEESQETREMLSRYYSGIVIG